MVSNAIGIERDLEGWFKARHINIFDIFDAEIFKYRCTLTNKKNIIVSCSVTAESVLPSDNTEK